MNARLVLDAKAVLGEGAVWNTVDQKLYWVDIEAGLVHIYDPEVNTNISFTTGQRVGTVVPAGKNEALVALQDGIAMLNLRNGAIDYKINTSLHKNKQRFNDGKCDPEGRLWVGSLSLAGVSGDSHLYCTDGNFRLYEKMHGLSISNGITWSLDGTAMYHIDTPTGQVTRHDFNRSTGEISNREVIISIPHEHGYPDGMTIDGEGMLWIALWDGFAVARYNPGTGQLLSKIDVPAPKVTSCAFGGKDLDQLYITSARSEMSTEELETYPLSGGLFVAGAGIKGVASYHFSC